MRRCDQAIGTLFARAQKEQPPSFREMPRTYSYHSRQCRATAKNCTLATRVPCCPANASPDPRSATSESLPRLIQSGELGKLSAFAMEESTITSRGRTTLPKPVREALGVSQGDRVRYVILDKGVRILPIRPISRLFGALKSHYSGPPATLEDMNRAIAKGACEE